MKFAAHDGHTICAIGATELDALAKAARDIDATRVFEVARISDALADWIEENGWNGNTRSFDVRDGAIVDITDEV
jgi:hypothetical protein